MNRGWRLVLGGALAASLLWPARGQTTEDLSGQVTASLAGSRRTEAILPRLFWNTGEAVEITALVSPVSFADIAAQKLKGQWQQMASALKARSDGKNWAVVLTIADERTHKPVWEQAQPLEPQPLADASALLVPDQTARSRFDLNAAVTFTVPAGTLAPGRYRALLSLRLPDGSSRAFDNAAAFDDAPSLTVSLPVKTRELLSVVADSPHLLTRVLEVANPARRQFAKDDADDAFARSVRCLRTFEGRIFIGCGDWSKNRGPIDLWSFAPDMPGAPSPSGFDADARYAFTAPCAGQNFRFAKEYVVQDHSIDRLQVDGDKLLVPGIDGNRERGPDGARFGNLYIQQKGFWRKLSTIPHAVHVLDAVGTGSQLWVFYVDRTSPDCLLTSRDGGLSWQIVTSPLLPLTDINELVPQGSDLWALGAGGISRYRHGKLETRFMDLFPGCGLNHPAHCTTFHGGIVYAALSYQGRYEASRGPLFFLGGWNQSPKLVGLFRDKIVRDIVADSGNLYMLTGRNASDSCAGEVYTTRDLHHWSRRAAFSAPAMPNALALLNGKLYVGLAARLPAPVKYYEEPPSSYTHADTASGAICLLQ